MREWCLSLYERVVVVNRAILLKQMSLMRRFRQVPADQHSVLMATYTALGTLSRGLLPDRPHHPC
jgi:hypothetical protein